MTTVTDYICEWCGETFVRYGIATEHPTCSHHCSARLRNAHQNFETHWTRNAPQIPDDLQQLLNRGIVYAHRLDRTPPNRLSLEPAFRMEHALSRVSKRQIKRLKEEMLGFQPPSTRTPMGVFTIPPPPQYRKPNLETFDTLTHIVNLHIQAGQTSGLGWELLLLARLMAFQLA